MGIKQHLITGCACLDLQQRIEYIHRMAAKLTSTMHTDDLDNNYAQLEAMITRGALDHALWFGVHQDSVAMKMALPLLKYRHRRQGKIKVQQVASVAPEVQHVGTLLDELRLINDRAEVAAHAGESESPSLKPASAILPLPLQHNITPPDITKSAA